MRRGLPIVLFIAADGTDASVVEEALRTSAIGCTLVLTASIEEAERRFFGGMPADVILLRIAPGEDGRSSLSHIERLRSHRDRENAPMVVFAECNDREFIDRVYEFPMTCYVWRADTREQYVEALRNTFDFWCSTAVLPHSNANWRMTL